ncbi:MAG: hypothetical protein LAT61_13020 [Alcanivorax sp.]|nr:hypothetical protein [Alcanivorax sp.]
MTMLVLPASASAGARADADAAAPASDWQLITDRDNIQVFRRENDHSRMRSFRGVTVMPVEDFAAIGAQLNDYGFIASWMHMVSEITEIDRRTHQDRDIHVTTFLPWPVSNRDVMLHIKLLQSSDDHTVNVRYQAQEGVKPPVPGYVRMPEMTGHLRFEPLTAPDVRITFEVVVDPGGYIPAWLGNVILRDIPYFSLQRLGRMINQPAYQGMEDSPVLAPPGWRDASQSAARARSGQSAKNINYGGGRTR